MRPAGPTRSVAVLLIAGSGPTDRNGDAPSAESRSGILRLLAEGLARDGVISLRFDKRGVAASAAAGVLEDRLTIEVFADDAGAWARRLAGEPGVRCVVILGHSEGALIGALAVAQAPVCGYISVAGVGRPADVILAEQIARGVDPDTLVRVKAVLAELKAGHTVADPPLPGLFRQSVLPYLISWIRHDPTRVIKAIKAPVLILQGTTDLQVGLIDAQRLAAARPDARLVVLKGVNHVLKSAPADNAANIATYADPALPLAPGVLETIVGFVNGLEPRH